MRSTDSSVDVVVSWAGTPLAVERLAPGQAFTLGPRGTFRCDDPAVPEPAFPLVELGEHGARLSRAPGMRLFVDGRAVDAAVVDLAPGQGSARIVVGPLAIDARFDRPAARVASRPRRDARFLTASAAALALQAGLVAALVLAPAPLPAELPLPTSAATRAHFVVPKTPLPQAHTQGPSSLEALRRASTAAQAPPRRSAARAAAPQDARQLAHDAIAALGLREGQGTPLPNLASGLQGLQAAAGADLGAGGSASRELGPGGLAGSTVDVGGFRVRKGGPPDGAPWGLVAGDKRAAVRIVLDRDPVGDGLTREEIQRVMARALPRIRYCYERELGADPTLEGKVTSTFTVAPSGAVAASASSHTLGTPAVAACVDRVVRSLQFPTPRGGGQVVVTYPFVFTLAGT